MHTDISKVKRVASHFVMLSFLAGIISLSNGQGFEVVEADLEQAYTYINNEQYSQAQQIYEDVIRDYPGTEHAVRAQADLIGLNVILGRQQEAQASLEQLMRDLPGHEYIPEAISIGGLAAFPKFRQAEGSHRRPTQTSPGWSFSRR